jgi:hypothetical protein
MAEKVKRRVAAARMAVAFVAAGTIAGAAWAQGAPPTAHPSAVDVFIKGENVVNGSLFFEDFHKREVPSFRQYVKFKGAETRFNKLTNKSIATIKGELSTVKADLGAVKTEVNTIKGELVSGYLKTTDADSRYLKLSDDVVRGDGSVFTASKAVNPQVQTPTLLAEVPGMFTVDALGPTIRITNTSGGDLGHSACGNTPAGTLKANDPPLQCVADTSTESIQFFSWGREIAATVSFSSLAVPNGGGTVQDTVQILIGL